MKIGITGHTSGIGQALFEHFSGRHQVLGFSRSNGYDISHEHARNAILAQTQDCDIFINNAYNNFDRSQYLMLESRFTLWRGQQGHCIINISSRWTHGEHDYCVTKLEQDKFCLAAVGQLPKIINIKPGLIDTPRVRRLPGQRLPSHTVVELVQYILDTENKFNITSITFGI